MADLERPPRGSESCRLRKIFFFPPREKGAAQAKGLRDAKWHQYVPYLISHASAALHSGMKSVVYTGKHGAGIKGPCTPC